MNVLIDYAHRARPRARTVLTLAGWVWLAYFCFITVGCSALYVAGTILKSAH